MRELALFAGAGGGILASKLLGWKTVCAVEIDQYAASVLIARQNDGTLAPFPIWDDVKTFDGKPWRGIVDVVSGGFPCQDISCAGKGKGITGERSGLWSEFARVIGEVRPQFAFVENSPMLVNRGLDRVLSDLAEMGYDAKWGVLGASDVGAPHIRKRIWIVATDAKRNALWNESERRESAAQKTEQRNAELEYDGTQGHMADSDYTGREEQRLEIAKTTQHKAIKCGNWWSVEPGLGRVANGVAHRVHRLRTIGNGQVPAVAKLAWETLTKEKTK